MNKKTTLLMIIIGIYNFSTINAAYSSTPRRLGFFESFARTQKRYEEDYPYRAADQALSWFQSSLQQQKITQEKARQKVKEAEIAKQKAEQAQKAAQEVLLAEKEAKQKAEQADQKAEIAIQEAEIAVQEVKEAEKAVGKKTEIEKPILVQASPTDTN